MSNGMEDTARQWLAARNVIVTFLKDAVYHIDPQWCKKNAEALIARLAGHKPPMIITFADLEEEPMTELDDLDREIILESLAEAKEKWEAWLKARHTEDAEKKLAAFRVKLIDRTVARLGKEGGK